MRLCESMRPPFPDQIHGLYTGEVRRHKCSGPVTVSARAGFGACGFLGAGAMAAAAVFRHDAPCSQRAAPDRVRKEAPVGLVPRAPPPIACAEKRPSASFLRPPPPLCRRP